MLNIIHLKFRKQLIMKDLMPRQEILFHRNITVNRKNKQVLNYLVKALKKLLI